MTKRSINDPNILMVMPKFNNCSDQTYIFPVGIAYIVSSLKSKGFKVDCLNLNNYESEKILLDKLDNKKYDFVGTGNNNLGYKNTKKIIEIVKNHVSRPKIILGGPIMSTEPITYFNDLRPDFGVIGEGEDTIIELIDCITNQGDLKKIKGIIFYEDRIIVTPIRTPPQDLDKLPFPDLEAFDFSYYLNTVKPNYIYNFNYFDYPRPYPLLSSRSCPFNCTFCFHDNKYRQRSIKNVFKEIRLAVKNFKVNEIFIYDDCFATNSKRIEQFCFEMKRLQKEVPHKIIWFPQLRVTDVNPKILSMMKEAGCMAISYGFESFSKTVLESMKKHITPKQIDYAFKETIKAGIAVQANFIFGDISETNKSYKETLEYWKNNSRGQINLSFIHPYPGSEIYFDCLRREVIKDGLDFMKNFSYSNIINMSHFMSDNDHRKMIKDILSTTAKITRYVIPKIIEKRDTKNYIIEVTCPFCGKKVTYKNIFIKNVRFFDFVLVCRECNMRFNVTSRLRRLALRNEYYSRKISGLKNKFMKKMDSLRGIND